MWCVFYADGSVYSSTNGLPENAPMDGVGAISHIYEGEKFLHNGGDYYVWNGIIWICLNIIRDKQITDTILNGILMSEKEFKTLRSKAILWLHNQAL